ncbi:TonB-dependent receptor [Acidicapsa acidisoli]|uniref:TonB-dependent receptor n=1 Tax=Acidicapsa acidisoli TaxID=1615681 RepID=UPI0021DF4634|nr:carboxypeptidase regulatory-like domain-containing protein [Acidicapsa acidisoli]
MLHYWLGMDLVSTAHTHKLLRATFVCLHAIVVLTWAADPWARAQAVGGGQIQGIVTDPAGAAVADATIEADQTDSGLKRTVISSTEGGYIISSLPVGPYQLIVSKTGFETYRQSGIVIEVGNNLHIDIVFRLGDVAQTVKVNADASMVQTEDQSVSQVIDPHRIVDMPLNGRQVTQLILLAGAATSSPSGDNVGSKNYPSEVTFSVAGSQGTSTDYLMDGADNNDAFSNVNLPFPFPDAIQEFSVQTSGLSAQYGLHPGSVVNIVTRAGGNAFHGTLFNFFRNGDLNAISYFSNRKDSLKRNYFGGVFGGPIVRNNLFFFGGYQGTRTSQEAYDVTSIVPTKAILNGDWTAWAAAENKTLGAPFVNNRISPSVYNKSAIAIAQNYLPVSAAPNGKLVYGIPNQQSEDQYIGRIDWDKSNNQTVFTRYYLTHFDQPGFFNNNLLLTVTPQLNDQEQSLTFGHTDSFSSNLVNSFHAAGTRVFVTRGQASNLINPGTVGIQVSTPVPNYIYMAVVGDFTASCGTCETYQVTTNQENVAEDLFWTKGKHHFAVGANIIHQHLNLQGTNNANGQFTFNGSYTGDAMADFLLGDLYSLNQGNDTGSTFSKNVFAGYGQDSFQVTPRFTLNAGVRWESDLPEVETAGRGESFSITAFNADTTSKVFKSAPPGLLFYGDPGIPKGYIQHHFDHFEPRIGFALDPRGKGKESLRASYTLGFQTPILYLENRFENDAPYGDAITINPAAALFSNPYTDYLGGNPFPQPFPPSRRSAFFPMEGSYFVFPITMKPSYTQAWNLTLEKQLGNNWELTVAYLGNHVVHIPSGNEENPATYIPGNWSGPGSCGALTVSPGDGKPCSNVGNTNARRMTALTNPATGTYYSEVSYMYDGSSSVFDGLLLTVQHRFAKNFTLLSNYTRSKCLTGGTDVGDLGGNTFQNPANPSADRSYCGADLRNSFATSLVARTSPQGGSMMRALLGGWQIAPIVTVTSGSRFTPTTGTDNSWTGVGQDRPNLIADPYVRGQARAAWLNKASFQANPIGTFGETKPYSLVGPTYADIDAAVTRFFPLPETMQLEFRTECFNCVNHPNLLPGNGPANTTLTGSLFGAITTSNPPRILQLSLKVHF